MSEFDPSKNPVSPEMGQTLLVKAGTFIVETGISFGACVLGVALLQEGIYQVAHIPPGSIVNEITAMLSQSANGSVAVYQSQVKGIVDTLVLGGGTGTIFTTVQAIKRAFRNRDRGAGLY